MPDLRQLHAAHGTLLLLDAASTQVQVGWLGAAGSAEWRCSEEEAGVGLFRCLEQLGRTPDDAGAFLFCDGPGSLLGIRTSAMAIRTWNVIRPRPVFAYCSLALIAHAIGRSEVSVIADARRDSWHEFKLGAGLRRVSPHALGGEMVTPDTFRHWSPLPAGVTPYRYSVMDLLPPLAGTNLFIEAGQPDAFVHEEPSYAKWTPQIHQAPVPE